MVFEHDVHDVEEALAQRLRANIFDVVAMYQTRHYRRYIQTLTDEEEKKFAVVAAIAEEFSKSHQVNKIDGARIQFEDGWGLVRASNTQAILVLRFEAQTEESLNAIRETVEKKVSELIG